MSYTARNRTTQSRVPFRLTAFVRAQLSLPSGYGPSGESVSQVPVAPAGTDVVRAQVSGVPPVTHRPLIGASKSSNHTRAYGQALNVLTPGAATSTLPAP